jgi:hypothetical protein
MASSAVDEGLILKKVRTWKRERAGIRPRHLAPTDCVIYLPSNDTPPAYWLSCNSVWSKSVSCSHASVAEMIELVSPRASIPSISGSVDSEHSKGVRPERVVESRTDVFQR